MPGARFKDNSFKLLLYTVLSYTLHIAHNDIKATLSFIPWISRNKKTKSVNTVLKQSTTHCQCQTMKMPIAHIH